MVPDDIKLNIYILMLFDKKTKNLNPEQYNNIWIDIDYT